MNPAANKPLGIFFLDAGRKYFGVPAIRKLLDGASREGLDMMQLYVSDNQGFRFAPGDRVPSYDVPLRWYSRIWLL